MVGRAFEERAYKERRAHRYIGEKPVKVGEEYDVTTAGVGARGDAFARISNFIVFVPGAKEGDRLRIKIANVREKFAVAEIVEALEKTGEEAKEREELPAVEEEKKEEAEEGAEEEEKIEGGEL